MGTTKYIITARKLQAACLKQFGVKLLLNTRQWYSKNAGRAITQYTVMQSIENEGKGKEVNIELFKTYSQVQLVLFLRDFWYTLNGWEVPHDNETWEKVKDQYGSTGTTTE